MQHIQYSSVVIFSTLLACGTSDKPRPHIKANGFSGLVPYTLRVDCRGSLSPRAAIVACDWDFGDGDSSTEPFVSHIYSDPGVYSLKLKVTDAMGFSSERFSSVAVTPYDHEVLYLTNLVRDEDGPIPPLRWQDILRDSCARHNQDMIDNAFFDHTGSDGSSPFERITDAGYHYETAGENIAAGQQTPLEVVLAWVNSPGHYANIMTEAFWELGVSYILDNNSEYGSYWCQNFGTNSAFPPVVINKEAYATSTPEVDIYVYGAELATSMAVRINGTPKASDWGDAVNELSLTLPQEYGSHEVFVSLDLAGTIYTASDSIVLVETGDEATD